MSDVIEGILAVIVVAILLVLGVIAMTFVLALWAVFFVVAVVLSIPLAIVGWVASLFTPQSK